MGENMPEQPLHFYLTFVQNKSSILVLKHFVFFSGLFSCCLTRFQGGNIDWAALSTDPRDIAASGEGDLDAGDVF